MRKKDRRTLTAMLRIGLWDRKPVKSDASSDTVWKDVLEHAGKQTVQGLVGSSVLKWADAMNVDINDEIVQECVRLEFQTIQSNAHVNKIAGIITCYLRAVGLHSVLIKGQGVARYYRHPLLRVPGDIDLYLGGEQQARRAAEYLAQMSDEGVRDSHSKHFNLEYHGVEIELHRHTVNRDSSRRLKTLGEWADQSLSEETCRKMELDGQTITVPPLMYDVIFVFYHTWHHMVTYGVGLRQFCDWAMILHKNRDEIDREELGSLLRRFNMLHEWRLLGSVLTGMLGLPPNEFPFYSRRHALVGKIIYHRIFEMGNFGHDEWARFVAQHPRSVLLRKSYTLLRFLYINFFTTLISPQVGLRNCKKFFCHGLRHLK